MRICISTQDPSLTGGVRTKIRLISKYLVSKGHKPTLAFPVNPIKNLFYKEKPNQWLGNLNTIKIRSFNSVYALNCLSFSLLIKKKISDFDIYQGMALSFNSLPFVMANKPFLPWIDTTFEQQWWTLYPMKLSRGIGAFALGCANNLSLPVLRRIENKIYQKAKRILAVSSYVAKIILNDFKIPKEKIDVLPNPYDDEIFCPSVEKEKFILSVARLDKRKDFPTLLKAFKIVQKSLPKTKLVIIGEGVKRRELESLCPKLGLKNVKFLGEITNELLVSYYKKAKLFVLPSLQEGFGIVLTEAMACGTPVISTDCGGPRDIIEDGKTGLLVPIKDSRALSEAITELLGDESQRKYFAANGQKKARRSFSTKVIGKRLLRIYKELS